MKVQQIMRRDFVHADMGEPLEAARQTMRLARLRHLPVTHGGALVGILSYRDLLERAGSGGDGACVGNAMRRAPLGVVGPDASLCEAADRMCRYGYGCLLVTSGGALVGLVTRGDPERGARIATVLQKLLSFDAQLAMEAYIEAGERNLGYLTNELAAQSRRLEREVENQGTALRRSREEMRVAEELASIATLVAGLAHEIGTPMGVIQGHAKMLESKLPAGDADARWRLETIQTQIARISKIIQTLLNMARPRKARRVPVALDALLETTLSFVDEKLARRRVEVEREFAPVGTVMGDPERLQQLLLNLFLNAVDAMPDGGCLRVSLAPGGHGKAVVCVADTGTGIRPEDIERVFDPFFTTKPAGEGSGLGLMVCKGIVGDHGGTIEVTSDPDAGTEFRIQLPLTSS